MGFVMRCAASLAVASLIAVALAACGGQDRAPAPQPAQPSRPQAQETFFASLAALCGRAFAGTVVSEDEADRDFAAANLVMHVRECGPDVIRIPFHVGENRSRTWVLSRTDTGLRLKHDHRHEDGSEDVVTQYGGDAANHGTAVRQEFLVDEESKALFAREGLLVSRANVWAVEVRPGDLFAYELSRPQRFLRVEFDLTNEVEAPPPPWGSQ